ncbi:MAG: hypothetical protein QT10_C0011G0024 [archaeon GW2011_AR19]|nr:MAG: hypothetical protein QT10_C0011G0024 [archaeon GW2011_AR19]
MKAFKFLGIFFILIFILSLIFSTSFQNFYEQKTTEIKRENLNGITEKLTSLDLSADLIKKFSTENNPLILPTSNINSIQGTPNIQIEKIENYLKFSSTGEGGFEISTKDSKNYNFLIIQNDLAVLNSESGKVLEGSFSPLPFKVSSDYLFENGKAKIKAGTRIEYKSINSELKIKFLGLTILKQDNLESFDVDLSFTQIPLGGIYPINANYLKNLGISNLEYLGSSYEIPSGSTTKIIAGKLILSEGTKVKSFSSLEKDFLKDISEKLGFKFDENKMISFEGKNIDLGDGLIAEIPEGASINFDSNGNMLAGHTAGKEIKFNNGIDLSVGGEKSKTEGVYIFKNLAEAKKSGVENYVSFGQDFDAHLGDTSKSGLVETLFNRENSYVPVGENTHFSILGGGRSNEISSEIKIRRFDPALNEMSVVDNKGFMILNDNTKSNFEFGDLGTEKGKVLGMSVGKYLKDKDQVPMLVRNQFDKKSDDVNIQIASLYSDIKEKVYFTSNIKTAEGLAKASNLLSYKDNFQPSNTQKIPFMQDVFAKDVHATMDSVAMIEDKDFIEMFKDYKSNYKGLKVSQRSNEDKYFEEYVRLAKGDEKLARDVYEQSKEIVNKYDDFRIRNTKLTELYQEKFKIDYYPTFHEPDPAFVNQISAITEVYYEAEKKGYLPSGSSAFSLSPPEKTQVENLIKSGLSEGDAIKQVLKIGPNVMFSDPYIPAQEWWGMFR